MMIEGAAQASAAFTQTSEEAVDVAFLVMIKDIVLLQDASKETLNVRVIMEQQVDRMGYFSFEVLEGGITVATGTFTIAVPEE